MIDFLKLIAEDLRHVERLYQYAKKYFRVNKPQNNNYICFSNGSGRFRMEFRKVYSKGRMVGFRNVELCFSPHYLFNGDLHNGNDFTPENCINTILEVLVSIGIVESELSDFRVTGIEFGVNIIVPMAPVVIDGVIYTNRTQFVVPDPMRPYSKRSLSTKYKQIKVYAKGLQFIDLPEYGIDANTVRLEVKSKEAKYIAKYGICTATDLLRPESYAALAQAILEEWDSILLIDRNFDSSHLEQACRQFIKNANKVSFWRGLVKLKHRNIFSETRKKYRKLLGSRGNIHLQIKTQIIDKLFCFFQGADSTEKTPLNTGNVLGK